jgi:TonB family protein
MRRLVFLVLALCLTGLAPSLRAGDDMVFNSRHVLHYVRPSLPDTAKRMNLKGSVKLDVAISPAGKVTSVKPIGGHPLLIQSAVFAVKAWTFDSAPEPTDAVVTVNFD